jgi:hypothetical protein
MQVPGHIYRYPIQAELIGLTKEEKRQQGGAIVKRERNMVAFEILEYFKRIIRFG